MTGWCGNLRNFCLCQLALIPIIFHFPVFRQDLLMTFEHRWAVESSITKSWNGILFKVVTPNASLGILSSIWSSFPNPNFIFKWRTFASLCIFPSSSVQAFPQGPAFGLHLFLNSYINSLPSKVGDKNPTGVKWKWSVHQHGRECLQ